MCVIIYKPKGKSVTFDMVQNSIEGANDDAFGLMYSEGGRVMVERTLDMAKVWPMVQARQNQELFLHFRFATHGTKDLSNAHPYKVTKGLYLMHNGIAPVPQWNKTRSDTWHVARLLLNITSRHHFAAAR